MAQVTQQTHLEALLRKMQGWAGPSDPEIAHSEADDILLAALRSIARTHPERGTIEALVAAWESVKKWYS